jgi:hypothetical protein
MSLGQTLAGILNATCTSLPFGQTRGLELKFYFATVGNAVEVRAILKVFVEQWLIVSHSSSSVSSPCNKVRKLRSLARDKSDMPYTDQLRLVQTSMLGSILSNLLLVLGTSHFVCLAIFLNHELTQHLSRRLQFRCWRLCVLRVTVPTDRRTDKCQSDDPFMHHFGHPRCL